MHTDKVFPDIGNRTLRGRTGGPGAQWYFFLSDGIIAVIFEMHSGKGDKCTGPAGKERIRL